MSKASHNSILLLSFYQVLKRLVNSIVLLYKFLKYLFDSTKNLAINGNPILSSSDSNI